MTKKWLLTVTLTIVVATGCSRSASTSTAAAVSVGATTVAAALPTFAGVTIGTSSKLPAEPAPPNGLPNGTGMAPPTAAPAPVSPFPDMGDLFAPPKIVIPVVTTEPEPEPELPPEPVVEEPKKVKPLPQLRLIGFVEVEGLKALLSVEGKLNVVTIGDAAEGLQIIAIEPPTMTLKNGAEGEEFQMNLYDQPWFHPAGASVGERNTFGGKPVMPKGSSMPNLGGNAVSPGGGAAGIPVGMPQMPGLGGDAVNAPPGIPGFGGMIGAPGAPGFNDTGMPGIPGFPGDNALVNRNAKSSKKNTKNSKAANDSHTGMPSIPSLPGVGGLPAGSVPGVGAGLPGAASAK